MLNCIDVEFGKNYAILVCNDIIYWTIFYNVLTSFVKSLCPGAEHCHLGCWLGQVEYLSVGWVTASDSDWNGQLSPVIGCRMVTSSSRDFHEPVTSCFARRHRTSVV